MGPISKIKKARSYEETAFVLNYFGVEAPRVITSAKAEGAEQVILTDHNEFQQSVSDIAEVEVYGVVDHHRVANFETASPLYMRLEPVGSASSIVYRMFKEHGVAVPKEIAGLMLSGLISDTLLLKSPTTHPSDKVIAPELAELAGVNLEEYGLAMLKAGTNLASKSAEELIDIDAKTFELNGNKVRVAQVNTVDIAEVLEHQAEIEAAMQAANTANGYSDFVLHFDSPIFFKNRRAGLGPALLGNYYLYELSVVAFYNFNDFFD